VVEEGLEAFLPLEDMIDYVKERARMSKQAEKLKKDIDGLEIRLSSKGFTDKAPESVIAEVRGIANEKKEQLAAVEKSILDMVDK
jgi:valyl-tRNA synthetase